MQLTLTEMGLSYQCGPLASPFFQAHAREETQTTAKILLAEDNPGDVFLVRRALAKRPEERQQSMADLLNGGAQFPVHIDAGKEIEELTDA